MEIENTQEERKCKIKKVLSGCNVITPLLINLDNRALSEEEQRQSECHWYQDKADGSTRVVRFSNNNKDSYQGTAKIGGNMCKTMLVLKNNKTNKVQLIEVNPCRLERILEKPSSRTNYDNDEMDTTYEENKAKLLKAFGSKRSNRVSEIGSKMRINAEMMVSQIKQTTADVKVDVRELELADSTVDTCLPPCHRDATSPAGVYRLDDFLTPLELDSMEDEAFTIFHLMPFTEEESGYSQMFIDSLERLQNKVSLERVKTLLYVEALIRFISLPVKMLRKKDLQAHISPFSSTIAKKVIEDYTVDSVEGRIRNVTMDDKIVSHIIVLIVIACDSCNTDTLSKYLPRFNVKKIGQIARALCLSTRDKVTWFVKLPLPSQRSSFMRKRP